MNESVCCGSRRWRWTTGAWLLAGCVAGWALGRRFAQARCSETATLLGSDPRLAKHAAQTREARGEAVFPLAWPARAPMHAPAPEPLYNAPNPTQRVAFVVAGGLRTFANANAHRSLFWHGLRALGGSVEAIFVVSTDHGWHPDGRDFLRRSRHADRAKIRDAIAAFDPVHVEVHSNADCSNETISGRVACCPAGSPTSGYQLQAYWLAASLDVVRARERAVGRPYQCINQIVAARRGMTWSRIVWCTRLTDRLAHRPVRLGRPRPTGPRAVLCGTTSRR